MNVDMDRNESKKEEEDKSNPRTQSGPFRYHKNSPQSQGCEQRKDQSFGREREIEMTKIDSDGVRGKNREEGKAEGAIGLGLGRLMKHIHLPSL
jgi:hypothetical protein